jgi:UDP-N-acetylglucosamine 2-epimerase (non-hydrolysing)
MKHVITITGIRPDFIRMSKVFKQFDRHFKHTLIHTGQHFSAELSDVFFKDLSIREPDLNWEISTTINGKNPDHIIQLANLTLKVKEYEDLIKSADIVVFLGDSNSVLAAVPIKKMGVKVGHIEAGMRSGDKRMLEEINRITCDHASDLLFTYHENYSENLAKEGITSGVHMVGNTILEVAEEIYDERLMHIPKQQSHILMDIHRPENFLDPNRLKNIVKYANFFSKKLNVPVYLLNFKRMVDKLHEFSIDLGSIELINQMGFLDYLTKAYHSALVISDSGTAQEELPILKTPLLVPRDFTERKESYINKCSKMLPVTEYIDSIADHKLKSLQDLTFDTSWLGSGNTARLITKHIIEM